MKHVFWALFDSGNGSYTKVVNQHFKNEVDIYPIGLDKERKNDHFINLDLADYSYHFTKINKIYNELDKLPKPDLIIASPPCESWSNASAMKDGNACWKQEKGDSLFEPQIPLSRFTIRDYEDYDNYQYLPARQLITRINGELTIFHTIQIIKRYKPKVYIIENPAHGRIWEYIDKVLGFRIEQDNLTYYSNYDYPVLKPTRFGSNMDLKLKKERIGTGNDFRKMKWSYNERSNIPEDLVIDIFEKVKEKVNKSKLVV